MDTLGWFDLLLFAKDVFIPLVHVYLLLNSDSITFTYRNSDGSVYEYNAETDEQTKLMDNEILVISS